MSAQSRETNMRDGGIWWDQNDQWKLVTPVKQTFLKSDAAQSVCGRFAPLSAQEAEQLFKLAASRVPALMPTKRYRRPNFLQEAMSLLLVETIAIFKTVWSSIVLLAFMAMFLHFANGFRSF